MWLTSVEWFPKIWKGARRFAKIDQHPGDQGTCYHSDSTERVSRNAANNNNNDNNNNNNNN